MKCTIWNENPGGCVSAVATERFGVASRDEEICLAALMYTRPKTEHGK